MNPVAEQALTLLHKHLTEATVDLFGSYGIEVRPAGSAPSAPAIEEHSVMAVIGFAGEHARGALVLVASRPAIDSWMVPMDAAAPGVDACDTLGEVSNMLLGRLKGRLLPEGFPILLSTPTTVSGRGLTLPPPPSPTTFLVFDGPAWTLTARIDATFEEAFALLADSERSRAAEAGEMMLF